MRTAMTSLVFSVIQAEISSSFDLVFDTKLTNDFWLHAYFYGGAGMGINDELPVTSMVSWDGTDKRTVDISELWFRNIFADNLFALLSGGVYPLCCGSHEAQSQRGYPALGAGS